jgi:hypothetical protein
VTNFSEPLQDIYFHISSHNMYVHMTTYRILDYVLEMVYKSQPYLISKELKHWETEFWISYCTFRSIYSLYRFPQRYYTLY